MMDVLHINLMGIYREEKDASVRSPDRELEESQSKREPHLSEKERVRLDAWIGKSC